MSIGVRNQFAPARERTHYMKTWHCVRLRRRPLIMFITRDAVVAVLGLAVIGLVEVVAVLWWALT